MSNWQESAEAIGAVDRVLASVGMKHGRRATRKGSWKNGERVKAKKTKVEKSINVAASRGKRRIGKLFGDLRVVRVPGWERFPWLAAGFSTRLGGVSEAYGPDEQNLGWTAEDAEENVAENRRGFVEAVAGNSSAELVADELVTVRQIHSGLIRIVEKNHGQLVTANGRAVMRGDASMTDEVGLLLGVQTADCVPVLVVDTKKKVVAAFHAGWRGTLKRIVERGVGTMRLRYGSKPKDLIAAIGPAIGACCFAVGDEVRWEFESQFAYAPELFSEVYAPDPVREKYPLLFLTARAPGHSNIGPQMHLDLFEANRRQLLDAGLSAKKIHMVGECTACTVTREGLRKYFSHRAEHGVTGRMMGVVGVKQGTEKTRSKE
jgi:YfiH family protein